MSCCWIFPVIFHLIFANFRGCGVHLALLTCQLNLRLMSLIFLAPNMSLCMLRNNKERQWVEVCWKMLMGCGVERMTKSSSFDELNLKITSLNIKVVKTCRWTNVVVHSPLTLFQAAVWSERMLVRPHPQKYHLASALSELIKKCCQLSETSNNLLFFSWLALVNISLAWMA